MLRVAATTRSKHFNPLPPCGGRLYVKRLTNTEWVISIHSLLAEGDQEVADELNAMLIFQSTPSLRRETRRTSCRSRRREISIHSLLAEGDRGTYATLCGLKISIHSLLAEGDQSTSRAVSVDISDFNPLPPCGGRHVHDLCNARATHISIHSLLAEGDCEHCGEEIMDGISIHSLLAEGDEEDEKNEGLQDHFNPLPPCGGRLRALRRRNHGWYFNPLPPCGGRRGNELARYAEAKFQSTPSLRRETAKKR